MVHKTIVCIAVLLHRIYKVTLSPLFGNACRFTPFCSDYALEAITVHGLLKGTRLAIARVCRCHAWNPGGFDPVPPKKEVFVRN